VHCDTVIITAAVVPLVPLLQDYCPGIRFLVSESALTPSSFWDVDQILLHGSAQWLAHHRTLWAGFPLVLSGMPVPGMPPSHASTFYTHHFSSVAAGSMVDGVWPFSIPCVVPAPVMYQWFLKHIMDPATPSSRSIRSPESGFSGQEHLSVHLPFQPVHCRSVFSSTGWLIRPLTRHCPLLNCFIMSGYGCSGGGTGTVLNLTIVIWTIKLQIRAS
jgi:hypothetical protein